MKTQEFKKLIREEIKRILNEDRGVILSNEILDFLEERGVIDPSDAQKVHKDLTSFLKSKNIQ
jgi:predicted component of type VI protein secretion system